MKKRVLATFAGLVLAGCGGDDGRGSSSEGSGSLTAATGSATDSEGESGPTSDTNQTESDSQSETGGNVKFDLGIVPDAGEPGCGDGMGEAAFSYIWIANATEGTVSKINTKTGVEEGRYYTNSTQGQGSPSRTSVNLLGDVAVSNRGNPGGVVKVAAQTENCVDLNNNNVIETSTGPNDILPWGTDECVLWYKDVPSSQYTYGPRPTAWEGGKFNMDTCTVDTNPRLWIGYKDDANNGVFLRINGADGQTLDTVNSGLWGSSFGPYGGAVNANGDLIATGLNQDPTVHIDADTLVVTDLGGPGGCKYGMGLDQNGDIWAGACFGEGVYHYSFANQQWTTIPMSGGTRVNGIQVDRDGNVWGAGGSPCRLVQLDVETKQYINNNIPIPGCGSDPRGISIDVDGYVWLVDMTSNQAFKVHPETYQVEITVTGLVYPYTYSDMTGAGLNLVVNPPG